MSVPKYAFKSVLAWILSLWIRTSHFQLLSVLLVSCAVYFLIGNPPAALIGWSAGTMVVMPVYWDSGAEEAGLEHIEQIRTQIQ